MAKTRVGGIRMKRSTGKQLLNMHALLDFIETMYQLNLSTVGSSDDAVGWIYSKMWSAYYDSNTENI